jgi:O-antigen ligase
LAAAALWLIFPVVHSLFLAPSGYLARASLARRGMQVGVLTTSLAACSSPMGLGVLRGGVLLSGSVASLSAVYDRVTGVPGKDHWMGREEGSNLLQTSRVAGLFANPNLLGAFLALCFPLALGLSLRRHKRWILFSAPLSALLGAGLGLTYSRSSWLVAGIGALTLVTLARDRRRRLLIPLVSALVALYLSTPGASQRLLSMTDTSNFGISQRVALFHGVANMVVAAPVLGFGFGSFHSSYPIHRVVGGQYPFDAHGQYFEEAVETGVGGLGLFLLLMASSLSVIRKHNSRQDVLQRHDLQAAMVAMACLCLFSSPLHYTPLAVLFFALVGAATAPLGVSISRADKASIHGRGTRGILAVAEIFSVGVFLAAFLGAPARNLVRLGLRALEGIPPGSGRISVGRELARNIVASLRSAEKWDPGAPEHTYLEARLRFELGLFKEAETQYRNTLKRNRLEGLAWQGIARSQQARGDLSKAQASLEQALALDPLAESALHQKAKLLLEMGSFLEAETVLLKALQTNPRFLTVNRSTYPGIMRDLIQLQDRLGHHEQATRWRQTYLDLYGRDF